MGGEIVLHAPFWFLLLTAAYFAEVTCHLTARPMGLGACYQNAECSQSSLKAPRDLEGGGEQLF